VGRFLASALEAGDGAVIVASKADSDGLAGNWDLAD